MFATTKSDCICMHACTFDDTGIDGEKYVFSAFVMTVVVTSVRASGTPSRKPRVLAKAHDEAVFLYGTLTTTLPDHRPRLLLNPRKHVIALRLDDQLSAAKQADHGTHGRLRRLGSARTSVSGCVLSS